MDIDVIREAVHRQPFGRFALRLADGRELSIPHPDFVAVSRRRVVIIGEDESLSILEPLLIVSIEYLGDGHEETKTQGNA